MGDPGGIGAEVLVKALARLDRSGWPHLRIFGDGQRLREVAHSLELASPLTLENVSLQPLSDWEGTPFVWGELTDAGAYAQVGYIQAALDAAHRDELCAIVTGPIHKQALARCGLPYHGHTDWLEAHFRVKRAVMMLAGERLKTVPVTVHIPLREVIPQLSTELILDTLSVVHTSMQKRMGISQPRIAVCGVNPHAGDGGLLGHEDENIVAPAIAQARSLGMDVSGPHPGDTVFFFASQGQYDVVLGMFHDQALAPLKLLHFEDGINITLGLPLLRTSVDHGTAYDIAGQGSASSLSMEKALMMAATC